MIGTTLAHFKITGKLGEGGMGEVYRAEDTKLGREVALKVLPEAFAQDDERMARFAREAQVLASLNHTNIAAIYALETAQAETQDGSSEAAGLRAGRSDADAVAPSVKFLVMELVEGETLQERIARGAMSVEETARVGVEIARAMETAHEKGIVHRDLKPANIKVTPEGQIKVLDFGLAKALEEETDPADIANSPTLTAAATQAGIIMGTAAYMSPEQAAGSVADRRADIWSYGVVLSEMLTGRQQFGGETVSHTLASVLKDEPEWDRFPQHVPPRIVDLLQRCLRKDAKQRLQAIGEARVLWEEYLAEPESFEASAEAAATGYQPLPAWKRILPWAVAALLGIGLALVALQWSRLANQPQPLLRTTVLPPEEHNWYLNGIRPGAPVISPDGRMLAFSAISEEGGPPMLWIRPLDSPVGRSLQSTEGAGYPFWSPDGRHVAFFAEGKLKKIAVGGGPPVSLCDASNGKSGSWSEQGVIVYSPTSGSELFRVTASGGDCVAVTELDKEAGENSHRHPVFLPDGEHFLYLARRSLAGGENLLRIGSLGGNVNLELVETPANAAYAMGRLLFMREGTLMAQPFDTRRLQLEGEAVPLVEGVLGIAAAALHVFSVSETGELIYQSGRASMESQLVWKDRSGVETGTLGDPTDQQAIFLASDGSRAATFMPGEDGLEDIWLYDVPRELLSRFTFHADNDSSPEWSPAGDQIVFSSNRETNRFDLYIKEVGGAGEAQLLHSSEGLKFPSGWTPDGKMVLYSEWTPGANNAIRAVPIEGDGEPITLVGTEFDENHGRVSPDGRWLAYSTNESGAREVFVTTFPSSGRKWQVSVRGGRQPVWTKDGGEIIYLNNEFDTLSAAEVSSEGETFEIGSVVDLFDVDLRPDRGRQWGVTADGERFLLNTAPKGGRVLPLHFVVNWPAILENQ